MTQYRGSGGPRQNARVVVVKGLIHRGYSVLLLIRLTGSNAKRNMPKPGLSWIAFNLIQIGAVQILTESLATSLRCGLCLLDRKSVV